MQAAQSVRVSATPVLPLRASARPAARKVVVRCTETSTSEASTDGKIYIGNGRFVEGDPSKYPDRNELTGGWAGGETGLWEFKDELKAEKAATEAPTAEEPLEDVKVRIARAKAVGEGEDAVYIGNGKFIIDDARKYPNRSEVTGGFAAGEVGLKYFNANGEPLIPEGKRKQFSPLAFGLIIAFVGTAGSLILDNGVDFMAAGPNSSLSLDTIPESGRVAITLGLGLAATGSVVVGSSMLVDKVKETVSQVAITIAFLGVVGAAAYAVIAF